MPLLILLLLALTAGCMVGALAWRYPRVPAASPTPTLGVARAVGETAEAHPRLRSVLAPRLDPGAATGLALTLALLFTIAAGVLFGVLAYLVRTNSHLIGFDNGVARWGQRHASALSTHGLKAVTDLGWIYPIVGLCVLLGVAETIRTRNRWVVPFLIVAIGGEEILTLTVKTLVDRARPTLFNPASGALGPSFPSGHSATAAVFYASAALLLGRRRGHAARIVLAGLATAIAVAVAASRVLLDDHWLTDVIAGLALGWAWFAVCTIAFGGRLLRFGAAAAVARKVADASVRISESDASSIHLSASAHASRGSRTTGGQR